MKRWLAFVVTLALLTGLTAGAVPPPAPSVPETNGVVSRLVMGFDGVPRDLTLGSADDKAYVYDPDGAVRTAVDAGALTLCAVVNEGKKQLQYTAADGTVVPAALAVGADSSALADWTGAEYVQVYVDAADSGAVSVALGLMSAPAGDMPGTLSAPAVGTTAWIEDDGDWQAVATAALAGYTGGVVALPAGYAGWVRWSLDDLDGVTPELLADVYAVSLLATGAVCFDDVTVSGAALPAAPADPATTWEAYGFTSGAEKLTKAGWPTSGTAAYYPQSLGGSFSNQYAYDVVDTGESGGWGSASGLSGNALRLNLTNANLSVGSHRMRIRFGDSRARDPLASNDWSSADELLFYVDAAACTQDAPYISLRISEADLDISETAYEYFELRAGGTVYLKRDGSSDWVARTAVGRETDGKPNPTAVVLEPGFSGWVRLPLDAADWAYCTGDLRNGTLELDRVWEVWVSVGGYSSATTNTKNYTKYLTGQDIYFDSFTLAGDDVVPEATGISLLSLPDKRYYAIGEAFDYTGLQLSATYSDGSARVVDAEQVDLSGYAATAGVHTVTARVDDQAVTFDVMVNALGRAPTSAELVDDPALFLPAWSGQREGRESPFEEKKQAFLTPGGRLMSVAHRGDRNEYYPENSLEGILSTILYGADVIEVDIQRSADGVLVIMHDDTLTRTTDVAEKAGKNGLPTSESVSDWTYAQLCELRLLAPGGGVSNCQIPTLKQVIQLCKDRAFITLDKSYNFNWDADIYPLIKELKAYETVLIPYNYTVLEAYRIQQYMLADVGACSLYFASAQGTPDQVKAVMTQLQAYGMDPALRGGEFAPDKVEELEPLMQQIRGKYRYYIETLGAARDKVEYWRQIDELGYGFIMGNRIYDLIDYIDSQYDYLLYGDVNGDGKVSVSDVRLTLRAVVGKVSLTDSQRQAADVNGDSKVTTADVRKILRYAVGKIRSFA